MRGTKGGLARGSTEVFKEGPQQRCVLEKKWWQKWREFSEIKYLGKRCEGLMQGSEMENRGGIPDKEMGHHRWVMEPMRGKVGGVKNSLSNRTEADSMPNTMLGVLKHSLSIFKTL